MRRAGFCCIALARLWLLLFARHAAGQERPAPAPVDRLASTPAIALVDVPQVLASDSIFQERKALIETGWLLAQSAAEAQQRRLDQLSKRLRNLRAGSSEHTELELRIARGRVDLAEQIEQARRRFLSERAQAYAEAYRRMQAEVNKLIASSEFRVVLRRDGSVPERQAAAADVWLSGTATEKTPAELSLHGAADVTGEIIERMNGRRERVAARMQGSKR